MSAAKDNIIYDPPPEKSDVKPDSDSFTFEDVNENQTKVNTAIHLVKEIDQTVLITTTPNRAKFAFYTNIT